MTFTGTVLLITIFLRPCFPSTNSSILFMFCFGSAFATDSSSTCRWTFTYFPLTPLTINLTKLLNLFHYVLTISESYLNYEIKSLKKIPITQTIQYGLSFLKSYQGILFRYNLLGRANVRCKSRHSFLLWSFHEFSYEFLFRT